MIAFCIFPLPALAGGFYFLRYRRVIDGQRVLVGAFSRHQFLMGDSVGATLQDGRGAELRIVLRDGRKVCLSGLLTDFDELARNILSQTRADT